MARAASPAQNPGALGGALVVASSQSTRRRWIAESVRRTSGISSVHTARDRIELERVLVTRQPSIVLLARPLRGFAGLEGLDAVRMLSPNSRTIVIAEPPAEVAALEALKQGARGYCTDTTPPAVLCRAIELVQHGEIWVGRNVMLQLLDELTERPAFRIEPNDADLQLLTGREQQIRNLIAAGACNKDVANKLRISEKTVKAHLTNIFRKFGLSSRLQLAIRAFHPSVPTATKVL